MGARCQLERRVPVAPPRRPSWRRGRGRAPRAHPLGTRLRPRLPALSAAPPGTRRRGARESRAPTRARLSAPRRTRVREGGVRRAPPEPGQGYGAWGRRGKRRVGGEGEGKGTRERGAPGSGSRGPEQGGGGSGEHQGQRGGGLSPAAPTTPPAAGTPSSKQRRLRRRRALRSGPPPVRPRRTKAPPHDPRPPGAPRFPEPCPRRPAPRHTTRSPAARRAQVPGALPPAPRAPPHSQDRGLRRHGGHGLQQQMHAAHRGAEAQAAARTPVARPGGDLGQRPPARAQNKCQQAGARGAHGHDPRRAGRLGARTDSEGPARPPPAPDCARPPPRRGPLPSCAPGAGGASCAHARGSALPAPTSPRAGAGRGPPARSAAARRPPLRRTGWAPGVQSQVRAHGLGPRLAAVATRVQ